MGVTQQVVDTVRILVADAMRITLLEQDIEQSGDDIYKRISVVIPNTNPGDNFWSWINMADLDSQPFRTYADAIDTEPFKFRKVEVFCSLGLATTPAGLESAKTFDWRSHADLLDRLTDALEQVGKVYLTILEPWSFAENVEPEYIVARVGVLIRRDR